MDVMSMNLQEVYNYIDENASRFVEDLRELIRQPSVSVTRTGMKECAQLLERKMKQIGIEAQIIPTALHPRVYGEILSSTAQKTLLIAIHYDVVPPDPIDKWSCDPYAAKIQGEKIIGRGATDPKGNLMAFLKAVEAVKIVLGELPINLKFLFDGEEEIGSPSYPEFVKNHRNTLKADAVLTFDAGFIASNVPSVAYGHGSILYVELRSKGPRKDVHSSFGGHLVPNPAWRLVWALSTLKDPNERILIDGFYDKVVAPTPQENQLLSEAPWDDSEQHKTLGVQSFLRGVKGVEALKVMLYEPKCTITGFTSGYSGEGAKTVLPSRALAKVDFRLMPNQDPHEIFDSLQSHLHRHGFGDIEVVKLAETDPVASPLDSEIGRAVIEAAKSVYGASPFIRPRSVGYGRQGIWLANRLGIHGVMSGIGPPNWRGHSPDEFITREHFLKGIKYAATVFDSYARL
jgi:acetylornithine deacetylase/succinyl-diaminopimelate desuccinylase-like protein